MELFYHYDEIAHYSADSRVVTIGNFDGVHVGHQAVLQAARKEADRLHLALAVLTFEPHPSETLKPNGPRLRLVEPGRKGELLAQCGVDLTLFQKFDKNFSLLTAEHFAKKVLVDALSAKLVFVGDNFRFGRGREAGVETLKSLGQLLGFAVSGETLIRSGDTEVSSSRIRQLLTTGDVGRAKCLLGRYHEVTGVVARDRSVGKKIGFPTINLKQTEVMLPAPGIYAARVKIDTQELNAAAYIGSRPTMEAGFSVEAHLLDFDGDLYDRPVTIRFVERIRGDKKFDSTSELSRQIADDIQCIRKILEALNG